MWSFIAWNIVSTQSCLDVPLPVKGIGTKVIEIKTVITKELSIATADRILSP